MRIFRDSDRLVLCVEADDDQAMQELVEPLIALGPHGVPISSFLPQVYGFDGASP
jgi:hypothetical protein